MRLHISVELTGSTVKKAVASFGQACAINAAFPGAVYTALNHKDSIGKSLVATVMAGGDFAARAMVVSMLLDANLGMKAIPERWLHQLRLHVEIDQELDQLLR